MTTPHPRLTGDPGEAGDCEVAGYVYKPGGIKGDRMIFLTPQEVAHYAPIPDPYNNFLGMSWITPVFMQKLRDGWHCGGSDKAYKWYLEMPLSPSDRKQREDEWKQRHPEMPFPAFLTHSTTVAKFYTPHVSKAQCEEFIQLWRDDKLNHSMYVRPWLPALAKREGGD